MVDYGSRVLNLVHVSYVSPNRQLEAIIRISESLAKMRLMPFATEADVDEALRLFQVSTLDAALSGNLAGEYRSETNTVSIVL